MTISELAIAGKCAIFIPSPNVTNNHQYRNARVLVDAGAAALYEEKELEGTGAAPLTECAAHLLSEEGRQQRASMEEAIRAFAVPDANRRIWQDLQKLVQEKRK